MSHLNDNIRELFSGKSKTLIITVGNQLRSDDGVGSYIYSKISPHIRFYCLDAEDKPENIIDEAVKIKPERTVIIDAADFGGIPGEIRIIPAENIPDISLSTHMFPITVVSAIIQHDTQSEIFFLGIQLKTIILNEGLTDEVKKAADELIWHICSLGNL